MTIKLLFSIKKKLSRVLLLLAALCLTGYSLHSEAATFTVSNTNDSGTGSLRQAILNSNLAGGSNRIIFSLIGIQTITPLSVLPTITTPVMIDGTSAPNYVGPAPVMLIAGSLVLTPNTSGLTFGPGASGSTVKALTIGGFRTAGVYLNGASNVTVSNCYLGTTASGLLLFSNNDAGVLVDAAGTGNIISNNLISGNVGPGIELDSGVTGTLITGNLIGPNASGTGDLGNSTHGVLISSGATGNTVGGTTAAARNIISGNNSRGVEIAGANNTVSGNYIGTTLAGTAALANGSNGIHIGATTGNIIGGTAAGAGNVISGNTGSGVLIDTGATANTLQGNVIGLNAAATAALANSVDGIKFLSAANSNTVGGTAAGAGNVIGANSNGISIDAANNETIQGNYIGVNKSGVAFGNTAAAVLLTSTSSNNSIGGTATGAGNAIANNQGGGIFVNTSGAPATGVGNQILGNSIYNNTRLGIGLGNFTTLLGLVFVNNTTPIPNDSCDTDTGPNNWQNYPVLTTASGPSGAVTISGSLNSRASTTFRLEFFSSPTKNSTNYGEGQNYLGTTTVTTNSSCNATFSALVTRAVTNNAYISATATNLSTGDTSEFSQDIQATIVPLDHYQIVHNASCVTCQAETVTITPRTAAPVSVNIANTAVTLTAAYVSGAGSSGHGDWVLVSGNGTLSNGTLDDGIATYTFAASGESSVVFAYKNTWAQTVRLHVTDGVASDISGTPEANGNMTFAASAFRFTDGSNPVNIGNQIAAKPSNVNPGAQSLYLQAIRTDTNTGACVAAFPSGTSVVVPMASQCNNPSSCVSGQAVKVSNNGQTTAIAANPASGVTTYTNVPLLFGSNSQAPLTIAYSDVGQITLYVRYVIPLGDPLATPSTNTMLGSSNPFIVRPFSYVLSGIKCTSYTAATCAPALSSPGFNPAAANAAGPAFIQAGQPFTVSASAVSWLASQDTNNDGVPDSGANMSGNAITPNYGQETPAQSVVLTSSLVAPAGGDAGSFSGALGSFSGGTATGTAFQWSEVGIIALTPSLANYLSSGAAVSGLASGNIGRFIPDHFDTAITPGIPCPSSMTCSPTNGFTYSGQPFVTILTAKNLVGATTPNYDAALGFSKSAVLSVWDAATGAVANPGPATVANGGILTNGTMAATAYTAAVGQSATTTYTFRAQKTAPTLIRIRATDSDSITSLRTSPLVTTEGQTLIQSGQIRVINAYGSPTAPLPVNVWLQYWNGSNWAYSTQDQTSAFYAAVYSSSTPTGSIIASNPLQNITTVSTLSPGTVRFLNKNGIAFFTLAPPGAGKTGSIDLIINTPSYLTGISGRATFGVYKGSPALVYRRELY